MESEQDFTIGDIASAVRAAGAKRSVEPHYDPFRLKVAAALGIQAAAVSAFHVGSGEQVLGHFLSADSLMWFAPVTPNLSELMDRERHYRELTRIVSVFLSAASDLPTSLCVHCLCITDRCVALSEGAWRRIGDRNFYQKNIYKRFVRLFFDNIPVRSAGEPSGPALGPHGWRSGQTSGPATGFAEGPTSLSRPANFVDIRTAELDWVYPPGMRIEKPSYVKYVEESSVLKGQEVRAAVHRERFGPARKKEHASTLNVGVYPAIEDRIHSLLWSDGPRGGPRAGEGRLGRRGAATKDEVIDAIGVWDVQVLKAERLFEGGSLPRAPDLFCDTLAIYIDRFTNRVFCINTIHEKVGYVPLDQLPRTMVGRWFMHRTALDKGPR